MGAKALADMVEKMLSHGRDHVDELEWALPDDWLTEGTLAVGARELRVVETPGHTRGHVVFHDAAGALLFAGDHVLPTITPSIGFEPVLSPDPLGDFLGSLAKVRAMPDARLLPAHGPVTDSVHARVDELVAHHGARLDETEKAVRSGATTAFEVAGQLRWTRRQRELADLDPFNQMLAIAETAAHLELLVAQSRLRLEVSEGLRRYSA
jgi:glyoxylase-like metal-dependent hydrolase (beta-lactamase superfamily II)